VPGGSSRAVQQSPQTFSTSGCWASSPPCQPPNLILPPDRARGPRVRVDPAARPRGRSTWRSSRVEGWRGGNLPAGRQTRPGRGPCPDGSLVISVLARAGAGFVPQGRLGDRGRRPGAADPRPWARIPRSRPQFLDGRRPQRLSDRPRRLRADRWRAWAAGQLRARWLAWSSGADGPILLIGRESDLPYNRPPCSKGYLQGKEVGAEERSVSGPSQWYEEQEIEALTPRVGDEARYRRKGGDACRNRRDRRLRPGARRDRCQRQAAQRRKAPSSKGST